MYKRSCNAWEQARESRHSDGLTPQVHTSHLDNAAASFSETEG